MKKLKIRQYWSQHGRPWYVIRWGHKPSDYFTATNKDLNDWINNGQRLQIASK